MNNKEVPQKVKQDNTILDNSSEHRMVDRLDIQLLITVIIFFVSAWAYMNSLICSFTGSELPNYQMSYIFVHYVLTITLIFSVVLTAIKSYYILNNDEIRENLLKLFKLFLESWAWILCICVIIILLSNAFNYEWLLGAVVIFTFIGFKMMDLYFCKKNILSTILLLILLFPLFLSTMTSVIKDVEIETDKPFYSFSDKVLINVTARGYACRHKLVGLSEEYRDATYYSNKGLIMLDATQIKNNEIAVGTISPTTGFVNFLTYFYYKVRGESPVYLNIDPDNIWEIKKYAHFTPKSVYVRP